MNSRKNSEIWNHFSVLDSARAKCGYCCSIISSNKGSTGNLSRHMRTRHAEIEIYRNKRPVGLNPTLNVVNPTRSGGDNSARPATEVGPVNSPSTTNPELKTEIIDASYTGDATTSDLTSFSLDPISIAETTFPMPYERQRCNSRSKSPDDEMPKDDAFHAQEKCADPLYKDPYYTFGQYIANELRKYDSYTLIQVKRALNNVMYDADMGKYSRVQYSEPPITSSPPQQDEDV